ncbi:MAG TPA: ABC transporter ATP-binding protein [Actinomycetota bacterium]|nr:ABC transporter ATP-binding protein [Actinomycetota bacterium]
MPSSIDVKTVSKQFRLYHRRYDSLKERLVNFSRPTYEAFWALRDVTFDVKDGETVALIGGNGQGKSTLLQIAAGIMRPTEGSIVTRGRLAALLEIGAGFHPDLTGRENIYLNGSLLGLTKKELDQKFDAIVAFAEVEKFLDNQVKHYSTGMYLRLGFAVATHVDPRIILVDEVLAVGDEGFQQKCLERMRSFQREGRTIVFVSHNLDLIQQMCQRAVLLHDGRVVADGRATEVIPEYRTRLAPG